MEKKQKNSAIDKVEVISEHTEDWVNNAATAEADAVAKNTESPVKRTKKVKTVTRKDADQGVKREQMRVIKEEKKKAERAAALAKRIERAEEHKRMVEAKRELQKKRREALAAQRLRHREERLARREMLRNETAEARRERLAAERQDKLRLKKQKAEIRARLISEKRENARILKQQKREARAQDRREKRSRGIGGWLAAVIALGCSVLLLGTLLTFNMMYMSDGNKILDASYGRAYYDLAGCVDGIDVSLSKLAVTTTPAQQQRLLTEIIVQSELAESELHALPLEDSVKYSTGKYINQLADYSKTLSYKVASGADITEEDRELLAELYRRNGNLQQAMAKISGGMDKDFSFLSLLKPEEDNCVISGFTDLENASAEYPKLIYDGPFSDVATEPTARGLDGSEITAAQAMQRFNSLFADYSVREAEEVNECSCAIPTYNIEAKTHSGAPVYAQVAKQGGGLVIFNCYDACTEENFTLDECREIAEVFVKKAGFDNMTPVWQSASRAVAQFNFVCVVDGVPVYSDAVKVNVCMERGVVSALDATGYWLNHTERTIPKAAISMEQAERSVFSGLEDRSARKVIIPVGTDETLAYEVSGTYGGSRYLIYVDALTGDEVEIHKIIDGAEGSLIR